MSIKIPSANTNHVISRNLVKQMASDGFVPVIALEAFVEAGRTYQAYQRGGFDEARERITEEFSGAVFWLGGVTALNALFEKVGQKILKLPNINVNVARDDVRNPMQNYLKNERTKDGLKIAEKQMARFKFIKVISSVLVANAFIGFAMPKINQSITEYLHKNKSKDNSESKSADKLPVNVDSFIKNPKMADFASGKSDDKNKKDVSFGMNLLSLANKFENDRNYKLLSVDAGTASGRAYSARNNDERVEILFRDLGSVFFYMFNMPLINKIMNRIQQGGNPTRLDPVSAEFVTKYMQNYFDDKKVDRVSVEEFKKDILGKNEQIPESIVKKFEGKDIKIISLKDLKEELNKLNLSHLNETAEKMSQLQPHLVDEEILTESQVKDMFNGGHINSPEFLKEFYKNRFENFADKYDFVSQKDLNAYKNELIDYVNSIIKKAKGGEITSDLLRKASNHNLKMNALNWGTGFAISAAFLSTFIPKLQYQITKWRTGSNDFPGTAKYRAEEGK